MLKVGSVPDCRFSPFLSQFSTLGTTGWTLRWSTELSQTGGWASRSISR